MFALAVKPSAAPPTLATLSPQTLKKSAATVAYEAASWSGPLPLPAGCS
ncbi:hypothetical protein [Streptomyces sp. NBC_01477]|nr:hypothetical protein [Streptomyces sp. NBC_01477]